MRLAEMPFKTGYFCYVSEAAAKTTKGSGRCQGRPGAFRGHSEATFCNGSVGDRILQNCWMVGEGDPETPIQLDPVTLVTSQLTHDNIY